MTPTPLQRESEGTDPSATLTSDNLSSEPCDDPRTNTLTSSLLWAWHVFGCVQKDVDLARFSCFCTCRAVSIKAGILGKLV